MSSRPQDVLDELMGRCPESGPGMPGVTGAGGTRFISTQCVPDAVEDHSEQYHRQPSFQGPANLQAAHRRPDLVTQAAATDEGHEHHHGERAIRVAPARYAHWMKRNQRVSDEGSATASETAFAIRSIPSGMRDFSITE